MDRLSVENRTSFSDQRLLALVFEERTCHGRRQAAKDSSGVDEDYCDNESGSLNRYDGTTVVRQAEA